MNQKNQETAGVGILVAAFPGEEAGEQALKVLKEARELKYVYFENAAVIRQDAEGGVHYYETGDMSTGKGSGIGALIGGVIGILGGPPGIVIGAGAGAIVGGTAAHGDAGFKDESLEQLGVALKPNTSAIALTTSDKFLHAARKKASDAEIRTVVADLSAQLVAKLDKGKNVALGLVLSEKGLTITEVASKEKYTEVISIIAAKDGVIGDPTEIKDRETFELRGSYKDALTVQAGGVTEEGTRLILLDDEGEKE